MKTKKSIDVYYIELTSSVYTHKNRLIEKADFNRKQKKLSNCFFNIEDAENFIKTFENINNIASSYLKICRKAYTPSILKRAVGKDIEHKRYYSGNHKRDNYYKWIGKKED